MSEITFTFISEVNGGKIFLQLPVYNKTYNTHYSHIIIFSSISNDIYIFILILQQQSTTLFTISFMKILTFYIYILIFNTLLWLQKQMLIKMVIDSSHEIKLGLNPESARIFNRCLTKEYINEYNGTCK